MPGLVRKCAPILALLLGLVSVRVLAEEPEAFALVPAASTEIRAGKVAGVEGTATTAAQRFLVDGLDVLQPVLVVLTAEQSNDDIRVRLAKWSWDDSQREGSTRGQGVWSSRLRTQGELRIAVWSPESSARYQLAVWVGDKTTPAMRPILVPFDEYQRQHGEAGGGGAPRSAARSILGGGQPILWAIAGLLSVIVVLLAVVVLKGGRK